MDFESILALFFIIFLTFIIYKKRKELDTKHLASDFIHFSMYRTKWGLKLMDSWAKKYNKFLKSLGYLSIVIGFVAMIFICYALIDNIIDLFTKPEAAAGAGLVLPVRAKGVFFVPFSYWIISIFVIATIHEFSHGVIARAHNLKVKSSGLAFLGSSFKGAGILILVFAIFNKIKSTGFDLVVAFSNFNLEIFSVDFWIIIGAVMLIVSRTKNLSLPIIPAAFVEPDEKKIVKRPHKVQLSVFAAGPASNIILALLLLPLLILLAPFSENVIVGDGVEIVGYIDGDYPIEQNNVQLGEVIKKVDEMDILYIQNLSTALSEKKPEDTIELKTDKATYSLKLGKNPDNSSKGFMGASLGQATKVNPELVSKYGKFPLQAYSWFNGLLIFLIILNLGIGMFNLVPAGPLDGGRMIQLVLHRFFGKEKGNKIWVNLGLFFRNKL